MRIPLGLVVILSVVMATVFCFLFAPVQGAPLAVDCRTSEITAPVSGATVSGAVEIRGKANVPDFRFYKVEYVGLGRDDWALIGPDVIRTPVPQEGRLVIWQTTLVPDGIYRLRMHVVDPTGNYCELFLQPIIVSNAVPPTASPTPTATETAILTVVPPQATATRRPEIITDVFPFQTPFLPNGNRGLPLPDFNLLAFGSFCLLGACGMGSVVALIAIASNVLNRPSDSGTEDDA
jgi:hypothetical protein